MSLEDFIHSVTSHEIGLGSGRTPVHATLAIHRARVVELVFACEAVALQAREDAITSDRIRTPPTSIVGEGVGIVEAPRGLLTHHYNRREGLRQGGEPDRRDHEQQRRDLDVDQEGPRRT